MKTILKLTTVLALLLTAAVGLAKESKIGVRASEESKSLVLTLENASKDFTVQIMDMDDNVLYFEKIESNTISKRFDLQALENGSYFLTASDATKTIVYTVSVNSNSVSILNKEETVKPYFRITKERLYVNFLNLDKTAVVIKVYDAENRVVFSETVTEKMIIEKAFNFESAYTGNYRVVVSKMNKSYSENFVVD